MILDKIIGRLMVIILIGVAAKFYDYIPIRIKDDDRNEQNHSLIQSIESTNNTLIKKPESTFVKVDSIDVKYCESEICSKTAIHLKSNMRPSVRPCDNFYDYVCGNYKRRPSEKGQWKESWGFNWKVSLKLIQNVSDQSPQYKMKTRQYMNVCMNETIVENSNNELKSIMMELGGWPLLLEEAHWDDVNFNWTRSLIELRRRGFQSNYFFKVLIVRDSQKGITRIIKIDAPIFSLKKKVYKEKYSFFGNTFKRYGTYMSLFTRVFGALPHHTQDIENIKQLEMKLATFTKSEEDNTYKRLSISDLQSKYPFIDWLAYINDILHPEAVVLPTEIVHVADLHYLSEFTKLMTNTSRTPSNRTLANYIFWRVFWESVIHLNKEIRDVWEEYKSIEKQKIENAGRIYDCISLIQKDMDLAVSSMFVESVYNNRTLKPVTEMAENIRDSLRKVLQKVFWMDKRTEEKAIEKINKMSIKVGYSKKFFNKFYINNFYQDVNVDEESYLKTILNYKRFDFRKQVKSLRKIIDKNDWQYSIKKFLKERPYYMSQNVLYVPATSIHDFLYQTEYPNFINYGRLGLALSNEIIHAIDTNNRILDANGFRADWWSQWSSTEYLKKIQCISIQHRNLTLQRSLVDNEEYHLYMILHSRKITKKTINKYFSDIGGTKIAYHAYTSWLKENSEKEPLLYDFKDFNLKQMFWISFASMMCEPKYTLDIIKPLLTEENYSSNKLRVLTTLIDLPEFSQDFNCQPNDLMNKMKKCHIW